MTIERKSESRWWSRPIGRILWALITVLCWTLRMSLRFENKDQEGAFDRQFIVVLWHNRTLVPSHIYKHMMKSTREMCMITSASKDGALLTSIVNGFGMKTVRGSSHRRGAIAGLGMLKALKRGSCICIASDGPSGPMYQSKPGVTKLASLSGVPIVPACVNFSSCWRVTSAWDQFIIPKPFSRVELYWGEEISVPSDASNEDLEAYTKLVDKSLCRGTPDFDDPSTVFPNKKA